MFDTDSKRKYLQSDGHAVYKFAVNAMANAVKNVAAQGGYDINDLDIVIPHQANLRIIKKATEILGIPEEKVYTNIARMGNVSSACIPVCLDEMRKQGMVKPDNHRLQPGNRRSYRKAPCKGRLQYRYKRRFTGDPRRGGKGSRRGVPQLWR